MKKEVEDVVVVLVLIKGMDYLFASRWHFACLPNSCCGLCAAWPWLAASLCLYIPDTYGRALKRPRMRSPTHTPVFPQERYSCQGGDASEKSVGAAPTC